MPIEIECVDKRWSALRGLKAQLLKAHALSLTKAQAAKLTSLRLSNDAEVKKINKLWRGKNKPTNVLSFPAAVQGTPRGGEKPLGDVILGYETCAKEAKQSAKTLRNHATHLVVHGLLHLIGHDHMSEDEATVMEAKEIRILAKLGIANPYVLE